MNYELAAPVKGIANAFHRGTILTQRICRFAQGAGAPQTLSALETAQVLERSLVQSELRVRDAYGQSMRAFGPRYANAIVGDHLTTGRLHALTINLLEQLNSLDEFMDDPVAFDVGSFTYIQRESERCCEQAIMSLGILHKKLVDSSIPREPRVQDDRAQLPSLRQAPVSRDRVVSMVSSVAETPTEGLGIQFDAERARVRPISTPSDSEGVSPMTSNGSIQPEGLLRPPLRASGHSQNSTGRPRSIDPSAVPKPLSLPEERARDVVPEAEPQLILRDEVIKQMTAVEEWLQRRQTSRLLFHEELKRVSLISFSSMMSGSPNPDITASPSFNTTPAFSESPTSNSRPNSNIMMTTIMESIDRPGPPVPPKDNPWDSPTIPAAQDPRKTSSGEWAVAANGPEPVAFAPLDSPPTSDGRQFKEDGVAAAEPATALNVPGYGEDVADGIEVVEQPQPLSSDPGIMLADEDQQKSAAPISATSVQSLEHAVRHDSSFYKYGGFCDGAKMIVRGVGGVMQEKKRPGGMYTDLLVMKCNSCSFEVGYNNFHRDRRLDPAGILSSQEFEDMRYRSRFLVKSHLKTKLSESPLYGCLFCIEEGKTLEDQDATVFFTAAQLFRHLQKHPRRLREVEGVKVVYGPQPESAVDFDLHFLSMNAKVSPTADAEAQISTGGIGVATLSNCNGAKGFKFVDPERRPSLQFALGARIVGITYPPRFASAWCSGYHDSVKGNFPSNLIHLEPPSADDVFMSPKSSLSATARWDHKPKDSAANWLSFSKKEKVTHIGFPYQEFWCWSGQNSRGQWGLFPRDFVDDLIDASSMPRPVRTASSHNGLSAGGGIRGFSFGGADTEGGPLSPAASPSIDRDIMNYGSPIGARSDGFSLKPKRTLGSSFTSRFKRSGTVKTQASTATTDSMGSLEGHSYAQSVGSGKSASS